MEWLLKFIDIISSLFKKKEVVVKPVKEPKKEEVPMRQFRIVIDPGHGGKDCGAPGYYKGVFEKDITLRVAKKLGKRIKKELGCEVFYTRTSDKFLPLEERTAIANTKNADLFICECALPDQMKADGHLTPSYAGRIASMANVKKLVLTPFYPECGPPECSPTDITKQCRKTYAGPLVLADDLLTFQLD